ncbi:hypothetical protein AgCh_039611 [Apium graveolens]
MHHQALSKPGKVSPWKGLPRFGKKGKLNPRYVGPFQILKRVGKVAYELALPPHMEHIHNVIHVSMLKRYNPDSKHVIEYEPIELQENLSYVENPIEILEKRENVLRNKVFIASEFEAFLGSIKVARKLEGRRRSPLMDSPPSTVAREEDEAKL